jgi:RHS repeat-associated protein
MVVGDNKFRSMNFSYDANGRQVKATKANVADAWSVYDALGNRVAMKVNDVWQFVIYDAFGKLVAEYGTQGEGVGGVSYVLQDWQGSVRASVNNNGFIQARFDFTAFGEEVSLGVGLRSLEQGYTGDATTKQGYGLTEKDSSGQNHTWFRKQEQRAGRWTSPDPYKGSMSLGNPQSFNRYSYVESQPTNFVDPTGLLLAVTKCKWVRTSDVTVFKDDGTIESHTPAGWIYECNTEFINIGGGPTSGPPRTNGDPGGGGGGGSLRQTGRDVPKHEPDKDSIYDKCMNEVLFGIPGAGNEGLVGKWNYTVGLAAGKGLTVLATSIVIGIIAGVIIGTITETNVVGFLSTLGVTVTVGLATSVASFTFDVLKANRDFTEDARKEHAKCSEKAYGYVKPFDEAGFKKYLKPGNALR